MATRSSMSPEPAAAAAAPAAPTTPPTAAKVDETTTSSTDAVDAPATASSESADAADADTAAAASAVGSDTTADEEQSMTDAPAPADAATDKPTVVHERQDDNTTKEEQVAADEEAASAVAAETVDAAAAEAPSDDTTSANDSKSQVGRDAAAPPPSEDVAMVTPSGDTAEPSSSPSPAATGAEAEAEASHAAGDTPAAPVAAGKRKETDSGSSSAPQDDVSAATTKKQKTEANGTASESAANGIKQEQPTTSAPETPAAPAAFEAPSAEVKPTVSVDAAPIMLSRDDMAKQEEDGGLVKFDVITNDGMPEHMIQLTTLKNIFAKQLPKMPKEYIVRLVFDRNHRSMVILKNGTRVIGGICYRPFLSNHFAEIAFCAINAADQVKGYGTRLMNHLKEFVKRDGITHFLTYADNYAIGYFKKQGFAKVVSMPRPNWFGYIKDYDGGTLMECTIHHQINYLQITNMVHKQRKAIQDKIKERSRAHVVYAGLEKFAEGRLMDIYMIPGVKEAGWSPATIRNNRIGTRDPGSLKTQLTQLWKAVSSHRSAWPFHEPVDTTIVVDYLEYIKDPVDLSLIAKRIESGQYISKTALRADLDRMCDNCMIYNTPDTNYYKAAKDLQEFIDRRIPVRDSTTKKP